MQPKSYHSYTYQDKIIEDYSYLGKCERAAQLEDMPYTDDDIPTEAEIDDMYQREIAHRKALYAYAKSRFLTLHPFSRPDSLTRRGNVMIARRYLGVCDDKQYQKYDWEATIRRLFNGYVNIHKIEIDRKHHLRVWFSPYFTSDHKGWL